MSKDTQEMNITEETKDSKGKSTENLALKLTALRLRASLSLYGKNDTENSTKNQRKNATA
jgi:hypothetical protein